MAEQVEETVDAAGDVVDETIEVVEEQIQPGNAAAWRGLSGRQGLEIPV